MKVSIRELIKKFNGVIDETPLPFYNKSAKYYRTRGEEFRKGIKVDVNQGNINRTGEKQRDNLNNCIEIDEDSILK